MTVFVHDVTLNYLLEQNSIATSSPFAASTGPVTLSPGDCAVLVKTYRGGFSAGGIAAFYRGVENSALKQRAVAKISEDPNAATKSRIGREPFPDYQFELHEYDVIGEVTVRNWREEDLRRSSKDTPGSVVD